MSVWTISPEAARTALKSGEKAILVDVRTPAEHRGVHAEGAKNVPLDTLDPACCKGLCSEAGDGKIFVICKSGQRAMIASGRLAEAGLQNIAVVEGGTDAWLAAGLPCVRGKAVMDLERQVRIAAGSLVALGVLGHFFVHPYFVFLSLFVGCGLVFAGITNTCAMGMLISKMPWNRA